MSTQAPRRRSWWRTQATSLTSLVVMAVGVAMLAKGIHAGVAWGLILIGLAVWTGGRD